MWYNNNIAITIDGPKGWIKSPKGRQSQPDKAVSVSVGPQLLLSAEKRHVKMSQRTKDVCN